MIPSAYYSSWRSREQRRRRVFLTTRSTAPASTQPSWPGSTASRSCWSEPGTPGPQGGVFDKTVGDEDLYRIPDAGAATLTPLAAGGRLPADDAPGTPVTVTHPNPSSWKLASDADSPQVLRLRLTDVPGWHASIDGRPVPLRTFAGVMLQVEVPAGRHTIELYYWPATFTIGLVLAGCAVVGLAGASAVSWDRRRRHRS